MRVRAFAKINLGLKILGKRTDGFHEIETIFARIGIFDELEFRARDDFKIILKTENAKIPNKKNLVFRAAWLLQKFSPQKVGVDISLHKRIPIGAGLGGGSADAAATLVSLNKIWRLKLKKEKLQKLAASLGSDVPFFLEKKVCRASGRGEILKKISLPKNFPREVLLVVPPPKISSEWAYGKIPPFRRGGTTPFTKGGFLFPPFGKGRCPERSEGRKDLINDFEKIVFREFPEIRKIKIALEKTGAKITSLSGSGSAVFGLFKKRPNLEKTQEFEQFGKVFAVKIRD